MQRKKKTNLSKQIKDHSEKETSKNIIEQFTKDDLIPMGCTLLNLAMSGTLHGGAKKGSMINIIGASHGGKTILALTSFAEANQSKAFDKYKFLYDDVERANSFDMPYMFGESAAKRITPPRTDKDDQFSITVQHFHANVRHHINNKVPFIYVLDSFDALDALEDQEKADKMIEALEADKKTAGTYGMAKAKGASGILRNVTGEMSDSKSVLYVISQTRDDVNPKSFSTETRSGGRALKFYAHHEMWLRPIGVIKKKDTPIGNKIRVRITKNKLTGRSREVELDVYYDYGIDDIGSCIDYLIAMEHWSGGGKKKISTNNDFDFDDCTRDKLIRLIEKEDKHKELQKIVESVWNEFEDSLKLKRKRKYN